MSFKIIGRRFTPAEFSAYVAGINLTGSFQPDFLVIHNTGVPSLEQRPNGWTPEAIDVLHDFYVRVKKWRGSPHLFVDDRPDGIVVFNSLDKRGTHSPSWNGSSWGIEMLGNYSKEDFDTGRGALVAQNSVHATAILLDKIGAEASNKTIRLHKEDPGVNTACPGKNVVKADFVQMVRAIQSDPIARDIASRDIASRDIAYRLLLNTTDLCATWQNPADAGRNYFPLRLLLNKLHGATEVSKRLASTASGVSWNGKAIPAPTASVDGVTMVQLAAFTPWQNLVMDRDISTRTITLKRGAK